MYFKMNLLDINCGDKDFHDLLTDDDKIVNILEHGMQANLQKCISQEYVQTKILEFLKCFNSSYRLTISNCSYEYKEMFYNLLLLLAQSAKNVTKELRRNSCKDNYNFKCTLCKESLSIKPHTDFWKSLQEHDHFEILCKDLLMKDDTVLHKKPEIEISNKSVTLDIQDSSINNEIMDNNNENVNRFRFNFHVYYDDKISSLLYPPNLMKSLQVYEKVKYHTIQRAGPSKVFCLICCCQISCLKVKKTTLINHILGQKHLKLCESESSLQLLDSYHSFWLQQELPVQSHQVYMRPAGKKTFLCSICSMRVNINDIYTHIMTKEHKYKVIDLYNKKKQEYYLTDIQVSCYGSVVENHHSGESQSDMSKDPPMKSHKKGKRKVATSPPDSHNVIKSVKNPESDNALELLPNRMQSQTQYFRTKNPNTFFCVVCQCNVNAKVEAIKEHICTGVHNKNWNEKFKYYCEICDCRLNSELEYSQHDFNGGRHAKMPELRKAKVTEYECTTCKLVIFGDDLSIARHLPHSLRATKEDRANRLPEAVKVFFKSRAVIERHGAELLKESGDLLADPKTALCCNDLRDVLVEKFENCELHPFGSRISGIGNKKSDLDIFVDIGDMYRGLHNQEPKDQVILIKQASKLFLKNKKFTNIVQVLTARTPIITLHHITTGMDCDLSFKHGLSIENTKFLRYCMELQPILRTLILMLKKWLASISVEYISTYALAIMSVFYFQIKGYLPSVEKIREVQGSSEKIGGWRTIAYNSSLEETKKYIKVCTLPLDALLKAFFDYYFKFNYKDFVACPLLGCIIKKSLFSENDGKDLPREMEEYVAQLNDDNGEVFKITSFISIQDPFDLSHNLTKAVQESTQKIFKNMCRLSATLLKFDSN